MRARLTELVVLFSLAVLGAVAFVPTASGLASKCRIANRSTKHAYTDLRTAVKRASPGDRLFVQGTCTGTATVSIDLQLKGQQRRGSSPATLDASGGGAVLRIDKGARLAISSLRIIDGTSGGIVVHAGAAVLLRHSIVSGSSGAFGGGIANDDGTVIVNDSSIIDNTATQDGGGIDNYPAGTVIVRGASTISDNTAGLNGGGIANFDSGAVTLADGSSISDNTAAGGGGGVYNSCDNVAPCSGAFTLRDASIHNNAAVGTTAPGNGGGISNGGGTSNQRGLTVSLRDNSRVYNNTAHGTGGGIFNNRGTLRNAIPSVNVYHNAPNDISRRSVKVLVPSSSRRTARGVVRETPTATKVATRPGRF